MHCYNYQRHTPHRFCGSIHRLSRSINTYHAKIQKKYQLKLATLRQFIFVEIAKKAHLPPGEVKQIVYLSRACKGLSSIGQLNRNQNNVATKAKEKMQRFELELNNFVGTFKNCRNITNITNEINNESIVLPEDPFVLKIGFEAVYSNLNDHTIRVLLKGIKDNISPKKLEDLASVAIEKMSDDHTIRVLLKGIKDNISPKKLEELASVAIEKMSDDHTIRVLLEGIKDNISPKKLEELASITIEKMTIDIQIRRLLEGIKDKISPNKLEKLASIAIEKMSDGHNIRILLETINENLSTIQLENLRDQINPETPKACCTIM